MSTSSDARGVASASAASGISALNPLPSAGRFSMVFLLARSVVAVSSKGRSRESRFVALEDFLREGDVGFGAARARIVGHCGQSVARRFGEADVARDHGAIDLVLEELA